VRDHSAHLYWRFLTVTPGEAASLLQVSWVVDGGLESSVPQHEKVKTG